MKKKNEEMKQTNDYVNKLLSIGVKQFIAYAHYFEAKSGNIVELFVWAHTPETCIEYFNFLLHKLEKGELVKCIENDISVFLRTIHISEIHRCNPEILLNLYEIHKNIEKKNSLNGAFGGASGIQLTTTPDEFQYCSSIYFLDEYTRGLGVELDQTMGKGGFIY